MKEWTRSDTLALAYQECTTCHGSGMRLGRRGGIKPCNCVLRAIFRICYNRFRHCVENEKRIPRATVEITAGGKSSRYMWGRKDEEFVADFFLVSKRSLDAADWDIFRFHYLLGADWKLCCKRLNMERGNFFHAIYRIEQCLGLAFRNLEPYALYPLDEYFGVTIRRELSELEGSNRQTARDGDSQTKVMPIRAPLKPRVDIPDKKAA